MEVINKVNITYKRPDIFKIIPMGDFHLGSVNCDEDYLENKISEISKDKRARVVLMGDMVDCITQNDKRFDTNGLAKWVERDNIVESQRQRIVKLISPLAKQNQILAVLTGNHEEDVHLHMQNNIVLNICKDLGVQYGGYHCLIPLLFDRANSAESHQYTIHAWHGAGAAASEGGRIQRLMRLVNEIEARVYLMGHLHALTVYRADRLALRNGKIKSQPILACMTGSALKSYQQNASSYAERYGYKPSVIGFPTILISPQEDKITVEV